MKRDAKLFSAILAVLLALLLFQGCTPKIAIDASTTVTRTGTGTDRAMATPSGGNKIWDESYPYIGIEFEDGTGICLWMKLNTKIPEGIEIGDTVEVTYSLQAGTDLWILTNIKEVE